MRSNQPVLGVDLWGVTPWPLKRAVALAGTRLDTRKTSGPGRRKRPIQHSAWRSTAGYQRRRSSRSRQRTTQGTSAESAPWPSPSVLVPRSAPARGLESRVPRRMRRRETLRPPIPRRIRPRPPRRPSQRTRPRRTRNRPDKNPRAPAATRPRGRTRPVSRHPECRLTAPAAQTTRRTMPARRPTRPNRGTRLRHPRGPGKPPPHLPQRRRTRRTPRSRR